MFTRKSLFIALSYVQSEHLCTLYTKNTLLSDYRKFIYMICCLTYIQYESECRHISECYTDVVKGKSFTHKFSQPSVLYENNFIQGYL